MGTVRKESYFNRQQFLVLIVVQLICKIEFSFVLELSTLATI